MQSCFFANKTHCFFFYRSRCLRRLALYDFIFCLSNLEKFSRASLLAVAKSIYEEHQQFNLISLLYKMVLNEEISSS